MYVRVYDTCARVPVSGLNWWCMWVGEPGVWGGSVKHVRTPTHTLTHTHSPRCQREDKEYDLNSWYGERVRPDSKADYPVCLGVLSVMCVGGCACAPRGCWTSTPSPA